MNSLLPPQQSRFISRDLVQAPTRRLLLKLNTASSPNALQSPSYKEAPWMPCSLLPCPIVHPPAALFKLPSASVRVPLSLAAASRRFGRACSPSPDGTGWQLLSAGGSLVPWSRQA